MCIFALKNQYWVQRYEKKLKYERNCEKKKKKIHFVIFSAQFWGFWA